MISIVVSIVLVLLLAGGVAVGVLRARKKPLSMAIFRLILTFVALCISIPITALIAGASAGSVVTQLRDALPSVDSLLSDAPGMTAWIRAFCAAGVASLLLLILFPILNALLRIAVKPLARLLDEKVLHSDKAGDAQTENPGEGEKNTPVRLILGGLCGLVFAVAMLSPTVGTLRIVGDMASLPAAMTDDADEADLIGSLADAGDALPVQAIWYIGGAPVYKGISTYSTDGVRVSVTRETAFFADLADYLRDPAEDKGTFSSYSGAAEKSALVGEVLPDVFGVLFDHWAYGESYVGLNAPGSGGMSGRILNGGLNEFSKLSREQMKQSMPALIDLTAYLLDNGGIGNMQALFSDEDRLTEVYACLMVSESLHEALKMALEAGMDAMMSKWSGSGIVLAGVMPDADGAADEARALARATASLVRFNDNFSLAGDSLDDTLYNLGQVLDGFRGSDMVGEEQTKELMESALRSGTIKDALGYDSARAEEAIDEVLADLEGSSYADLLSALADKVNTKG